MKKKVLYISNIEVPYRTEFFNQYSKKNELTVIYERIKSKNRDSKWEKSQTSFFKKIYLNGINIGNEFCFDLSLLKVVLNKEYDEIIFGCLNSPLQIFTMTLMKILSKKFSLNIDGDYDLDGTSIKKYIKRLLIKGANKYYVAGKKNAKKLGNIVKANVQAYNFSSLNEQEVIKHSKTPNKNENNRIIIIGQYFDYKGLDIAIQVAKKDKENIYRFIGMGKRTKLFEQYVKEQKATNIEIIPFLDKEQLYEEYKKCKLMLLPSRKECWGLVVNEAASFGCPIISTLGCGAAKEIIDNEFNELLAKPDDEEDLYKKIKKYEEYSTSKKQLYQKKLIEVSKEYSIESMVKSYLSE